MGGANALLSSPAPLIWGLGGPLPPASPDLPGLPPVPPGPMQLEGEWGSLEGRGPAWELSRLPMPKWVGQSPSASPPLLPKGPYRLPLLISLASLLCPQGPTQPGGALEVGGSAWELSRLPVPEWTGQSPSAPLPLFLESPSHLPLLISLASWAQILSGLHFSSPLVPLHPTGSLWGSSHLLGGQSSPPAAGRHPSCGET